MKKENVEKLANELIKKHLNYEAVLDFYIENPLFFLSRYCQEVLEEFQEQEWKFELSDSLENIAEITYDTATISMSSIFAREVNKSMVYDAIMHEIAHALSPTGGHSILWIYACEGLGQEPMEQMLWSFPKDRKRNAS